MFPADEVVPPGVNGMLVRSLGWVQLPQEKEKMLGDVASALDSLGVAYEVVRGELSHVVWVAGSAPPSTTNPAAKSDGEAGSCVGSCTTSCGASVAQVATPAAEGGGTGGWIQTAGGGLQVLQQPARAAAYKWAGRAAAGAARLARAVALLVVVWVESAQVKPPQRRTCSGHRTPQ